MEPLTELSIWLIIIGTGVLLVTLIIFSLIPKIGKTLGIITFVAFLVLTGVASSSLLIRDLVNNPTRTRTQAQTDNQPTQIEFSQITSTQFTLTWRTATSVLGAIKYGTIPNNLTNVGTELNPVAKKTRHSITVTDLQPNQTYFVEIISGGQVYQPPQPLSITLPQR